jgi:hypothetical protein
MSWHARDTHWAADLASYRRDRAAQLMQRRVAARAEHGSRYARQGGAPPLPGVVADFVDGQGRAYTFMHGEITDDTTLEDVPVYCRGRPRIPLLMQHARVGDVLLLQPANERLEAVITDPLVKATITRVHNAGPGGSGVIHLNLKDTAGLTKATLLEEKTLVEAARRLDLDAWPSAPLSSYPTAHLPLPMDDMRRSRRTHLEERRGDTADTRLVKRKRDAPETGDEAKRARVEAPPPPPPTDTT